MDNYRILYEDEELLICFKPAGLPVQSKNLRTKDLEHLLLGHLKGEAVPYLAVVHRLDQPVQGLLTFAKTPFAAASFSAQSRDGKMQKEYLALVEVCPDHMLPARGELTDYLVRDGRRNVSRVANKGEREAKKASLSFEDVTEEVSVDRLLPSANASPALALRVLRIRLHTGRHHQIRVQLSHAGFPVAGDQKYGSAASCSCAGPAGWTADGQHKEKQPGSQSFRYPALCAYRLSFFHPVSGERMTFSLPAEEIRFS